MEIIRLIIPLFVGISVFLIPIGGMFTIAFAIMAAHEQDKVKKKKHIWGAVLSVGIPIALIFLCLSLWGIVSVIKATFAH